MTRLTQVYNSLIRTHHITSRKKVQKLRKAASDLRVDYVLLRSGGSPGIMYAESRDEAAIREWVAAVQALRYKDYRCAIRPGPCVIPGGVAASSSSGFREVESVAEFGEEMECRGLGSWWTKGMGYGVGGEG